MKSRYDYMTESDYGFDTTIDDSYPDPLSLNYLKFNIQSGIPPVLETMNLSNIQRFWKLSQKAYGKVELDDIVLTLNGIEHRNFLKVGDKVMFPSEQDIDNSFRKNNQ